MLPNGTNTFICTQATENHTYRFYKPSPQYTLSLKETLFTKNFNICIYYGKSILLYEQAKSYSFKIPNFKLNPSHILLEKLLLDLNKLQLFS